MNTGDSDDLEVIAPDETTPPPDVPFTPVGVPAIPSWMGVYFIQGGSLIKIGIALSVIERWRVLQLTAPVPLLPIGFIPTDTFRSAYDREREIHRTLSAHRSYGEWFHDCDELRDFIRSQAKSWPAVSR